MNPEPKSIHTYLDSRIPDVYAYGVDVCVTDFPQSADPQWLYYFGLTVFFTDDNCEVRDYLDWNSDIIWIGRAEGGTG